MEYVIVTFPTRRRVSIDGEYNGLTNEVLRLDAGTHLFSLGRHANYRPAEQQALVQDTSVLQPMQIAFTRKEV